jgi:hemolysin activation/secretion protein
VTASNEGNDSTGRNQVLADLRWFSPLGRGDRASLALSKSLGARSATLAWAVPLSARWGTRLQASLSRSHTHIINGPFAVFDIRGESAQESLSLGQPVWMSGPWAVDAQLSWTRSKSENLFAGIGLGATKLHQSNLSLTTSYRSGPHDGSAYVGWLSGSAKAANGLKTQDSKLQWGGSYVYRMPEQSSLILMRLNGQSARGATPLGSQSLSLGGPSSLRAFSSGTLSDESGYAMSAEFHHALTQTLGVQLFAEQGDVWGAGGRAGLRDWGVAAEWRYSKSVTLNLTTARVMGPLPAGQGRVRNYLRLNAAF